MATGWSITCDKGRESPIEFLEKIDHPYDLIIEQITIGDYAISLNGEIKVIIERKTWSDLAATIKDPDRKANHFKLLDLREKTGCTIVYIIEGVAFPPPERKFGGIPHKALLAHLHHIMVRDRCSYMQSRDPEHTAEMLIALTTSMTTLGIEGGGAPNGKLLKERQIRSPEVTNQKIMMKIRGVSAANLAVITEHYTVSDLVSKQLTPELTELKHVSGKRFGPKHAARINDCAKDVKTHINMLAEINGVTRDVATKILQTHPMINLASGEVKAQDLASVKKTSTKNVGPVLAERILASLKTK